MACLALVSRPLFHFSLAKTRAVAAPQGREGKARFSPHHTILQYVVEYLLPVCKRSSHDSVSDINQVIIPSTYFDLEVNDPSGDPI